MPERLWSVVCVGDSFNRIRALSLHIKKYLDMGVIDWTTKFKFRGIREPLDFWGACRHYNGRRWIRMAGITNPGVLIAERDAATIRANRCQMEYEAVLSAAAWQYFGRDINPWDYRISGIWQDGFLPVYKDRLRSLICEKQLNGYIARECNDALTYKQGKIRK